MTSSGVASKILNDYRMDRQPRDARGAEPPGDRRPRDGRLPSGRRRARRRSSVRRDRDHGGRRARRGDGDPDRRASLRWPRQPALEWRVRRVLAARGVRLDVVGRWAGRRGPGFPLRSARFSSASRCRDRLQHRAGALIAPLRDLFAATFFLFFSFPVAAVGAIGRRRPALALAVVAVATKFVTPGSRRAHSGSGPRGRLRAARDARGSGRVLDRVSPASARR